MGVYGQPVDKAECARRVGKDDKVKMQVLKQGVIDTISGPVVDSNQRFHPTGWAVGNSASPGLTKMYVAPGSTLGNALMTGYIAAKEWSGTSSSTGALPPYPPAPPPAAPPSLLGRAARGVRVGFPRRCHAVHGGQNQPRRGCMAADRHTRRNKWPQDAGSRPALIAAVACCPCLRHRLNQLAFHPPFPPIPAAVHERCVQLRSVALAKPVGRARSVKFE